MDGRALLDVARELAAGSTEAHWRSSVGRAYYALLHEVLGALGRWGFALPPREKELDIAVNQHPPERAYREFPVFPREL